MAEWSPLLRQSPESRARSIDLLASTPTGSSTPSGRSVGLAGDEVRQHCILGHVVGVHVAIDGVVVESVTTDEVTSESLRLDNAVHVRIDVVVDELDARLGI